MIDQAGIKRICGTDDPLLLKLRGGGVTRYHVEPGCAAQTVADHSWRVAVIAHELWPERPHLVMAALYHDVAEGLTGDMPAPIKRLGDAKETVRALESIFHSHVGVHAHTDDLLDEDVVRLKCADYLELVLTCSGQHTRDAARVAQTGVGYVIEQMQRLPSDEAGRVSALLDYATGRRVDRTGQEHPFGFVADDER